VTWNLACPDWEDRLRTGRSLVPDLPLLNVAEGDRAVRVFDKLRLADVPGTPTMGEAGGEWFRDIIRALFGAWDPVARARMIRELFLLVPKKNSKTTNGALLMLTALLLNQRPRAPFLLTAPVQKTADEAFQAIAGAIALDPVLEAKLHVRDHLKVIVHRETKAKLEVMTFDPAIITGRKVAGALIDELHVLGKMPRADKAMLQMRGGMQPFPESFLATITTQSDEPPVGVFKDDLQRARDVRDGKRQSPVLAVLYEFPTEMQQDPKAWRDPKNWPMVMPNIGRSVFVDRLLTECADEEAKGEGAFRTWASQHLDVQIGLALMAQGWAGAPFWEANGIETLPLEEVLERSEVVTIGGDGGGLDDLLGLAVLGRERIVGADGAVTHRWLLWTRAWAHPSVFKLRMSEDARLRDFIKDGDLILVKEMGDDIAEFADIVEQVETSGKLDRIGLDPAGIGAIVDAITARNIESERIVGISQGWKLMGAIKTAERKLAEGTLIHGGQPLMAWCVGNAKREQKGNAMLITKQASGTAKIDPLMAAFNAVALMSMNPEAMVIDDDYELLTV
jgi:phage terminase large subunit-like protein